VATNTPENRFRVQDRVVGRRPDEDQVIRLEIYGILVLAFAVALLLALLTFDGADVAPAARGRGAGVSNLIGPVGAQVADLFLDGLGGGAFVLALGFAYFGASYLIGRRARVTKLDLLGWLGLLLSGAVLCHVVFAPAQLLDHPPGGETGAWVGEISASLLSSAGTAIAFSALFLVSLIAVTRRSVFELAHLLGHGGKRVAGLVRRGMNHGDGPEGEAQGAADEADARPSRWRWPWRRGVDDAMEDDATEEGAPDEAEPTPGASQHNTSEDKTDEGPKLVVQRKVVAAPEAPEARRSPAVDPFEEDGEDDGPVIVPPPVRAAPSAAAATADEADDDAVDELSDDGDGDDELEVVEVLDEDGEDGAGGVTLDADGSIKIIESAAMRRSRDLIIGEQLELGTTLATDEKPYALPGLALLDYRPPETTTYDRELLRKNAQILEAKLLDYRVKGKVVEIHPGPVITMYEFMPAAGVKISTIANLSDDLAMALSALRIRIVAPIPGKNVVGIEVPNKSREVVWLKEILSDTTYTKARSDITLALGKDIVGNPAVMNLAKAPHLLVAGATGSGKSVAINSFIVSMLYKATPADVRLIMVDPKMLELSIYEGIPHLLLPVVTDPKQAAVALRWAVKEMERRYQLMADMGVRNLANYNGKVESLREDPRQRLPERLRLAKLKREARGEPDPAGVVLDTDGREVERLPLIVVIIDELADLMMVASKEVEHSIARLAQMARASGIHLILATQRPSVDVITGLIKANFPTRISFQVASKVDSRTILDRGGAENLLGMGDMLYLPPGTSAVQRVHGAYVSEDEVHRLVAHLKEQGQPDYDLGILTHEDEDGDDAGPARDGDEYDEFYDRAVKIIAETRNASISFLQRKLKIGYNRSARIIEKMEEDGIVGPSDGTSRPREVFIEPI
jgi:S-DNA-T family DNA segregation ATPase FtsK/SpoIIIE